MTQLADEALKRNRQDASGDLSTMPIHMADIGSDTFEHDFTLTLMESEEKTLHKIEQALSRIEDGTYGRCVADGEPIDEKRLEAVPWTPYCRKHQSELEERAAQLAMKSGGESANASITAP